MRTRFLLICFFLFSLLGCLPKQEPVSVTRPVVAIATRHSEVATAVPPTVTPPPTHTPESTLATTATAVPPTVTPLPTSTPKPAWPTTPILFVRDGALHRWLPQTNEVELLVQGVDSDPVFAPNIAVFMREVVPQQEYALIVFHIPTRTEVELLRQPAIELPNSLTGVVRYVPPLSRAITVAPNGRWLAYVLPREETNTFALFAHEIRLLNDQLSVSEVLFTRQPTEPLGWPFLGSPEPGLMWPTADELSWNEPSGIWIAKLATTPISSKVEILASTSTVLTHSMNPADEDEEPFYAFTIFSPYQWSPAGRFLLAIEHFPGESMGDTFQIIERGTSLISQLPDSSLGPLSDNAVWLDDTRVLHYRMDGLVKIWRVNSDNENFLTLEAEFHAAPPGENLFQVINLFPLSANHVRVEDPFSDTIYDLDLTTQKLTVIGGIDKSNYDRYFWSPGGQYALGITYINQNNEQIRPIKLIFLDGKPTIDMSHIFGTNSCCWYWELAGSE